MAQPTEHEVASQLDSWLLALGHPLRRRIVGLLLGRVDSFRGLSPAEISETVELPLTNVSYHVRSLVEFGALELNDTEQVRGSIKHFYVLNRQFRTRNWVLAVLEEGLKGDSG
jgi:DNA-binding transcriptional ArsR family regulator